MPKSCKSSEIGTCESTTVDASRRESNCGMNCPTRGIWITTSSEACKGSDCAIEASNSRFGGENSEAYFEGATGKYYLTRFLDRHCDLVSNLSSKDKWRVKQSDSGVIQPHFNKVQQVRKKYSITAAETYNIDKNEFARKFLAELRSYVYVWNVV